MHACSFLLVSLLTSHQLNVQVIFMIGSSPVGVQSRLVLCSVFHCQTPGEDTARASIPTSTPRTLISRTVGLSLLPCILGASHHEVSFSFRFLRLCGERQKEGLSRAAQVSLSLQVLALSTLHDFFCGLSVLLLCATVRSSSFSPVLPGLSEGPVSASRRSDEEDI